jgi:3-hydroxymyristoyl/3-hydroxydecanoyl-(acyl carrier protein) dehydratase
MKFRLIDKILSWTPYKSISGIKAVSFEEYQLKESFGDEARLPEMLLLESVLQLGNWLILLSSDFTRMGMVAKLGRVCFHDFLRPGQQLRVTVNLLQQDAHGFVFSGQGAVADRKVISGLRCLAISVPAHEYVNPDDMRVLFSEIYQPESAP